MAPWIFRHPDRQGDWEANKCALYSRECRDGERPTSCRYEAERGIVFDSAGASVCVASELLNYQLCRSGRSVDLDRIVCTDLIE